MKAYTFDLKLDASITIEAVNADEALRYIRQAFECADCNGGLFQDGEPVLFEATMNERPSIGMIDGDDVSIVTLNDWDALRTSESGSWEAA